MYNIMALKSTFRAFAPQYRISHTSRLSKSLAQRCFLSYEEIPRNSKWSLSRNLPYFFKYGGHRNLHRYIDDLHRKFGPFFIEEIQGLDFLFISDAFANIQVHRSEGPYPEHFVPEAWLLYLQETGRKRGLFFMNGPEWQQCRKILNKHMLRKGTVDSYSGSLSSIVDDLVSQWKNELPVKNLEYTLYNWNIECLGAIVFGKRLGFIEHIDTRSPTRNHGHLVKSIHDIFEASSPLMDIPPLWAKKLRLNVWKRFHHSVTNALDIGRELIEELLEDSKENEIHDTLLNKLVKDSMDKETISNVMIDLLLAASDTTSQVAIWALYLLGKNPEVAEKARGELKEMCDKNGSFTTEDIQKLRYIRAIIKETLRLYPIAPFLTRILHSDSLLGRYEVPAKTFVITSLYTMGRNEEYFSDPLRFLPERWIRDDSSKESSNTCIPKHDGAAYVPWGLGARSCIGRRMAEVELSIFIAKLLLNFEWRTTEDVNMVLKMVSVPSKPLSLEWKVL